MNEGTCTVCIKPAKLRCSNCKLEYYCDKKHQRDDWQRHKLFCRAWEIKEFSDRGRCLIATRDMKPGDIIVSEPPIVWGPSAHRQERVCVGCGEKNAWARCPDCSWAVCKEDCPGISDPNRHGLECKFLKKARIIPRFDILLVLRILILRRRYPKRWEVLSKLESHECKRGPGTDAYKEVQNIAENLNLLLTLDLTSREALPKICGLIDVNALETNPPDGSAAIYETTCLLEHQCVANTRYHFSIDAKGRPKITVKAVTSIKKGEHLSTTYTHVLWCTKVRREHLLATKYFVCHCARCTDPTELGSHLGSFKCPCGKGFMTPNDPLNPDSEWSCNLCLGILTSTEANDLLDRLKLEVDNAMEIAQENALTDLLSRLNVLLHPNHQYCISVSHTLLQLLSPSDPMKLDVCKRVLDTMAIVDPYGSRLALYTAVALREFASCTNIKEEEHNRLLKRAIFLLQSEPPNSAGEKLMNIIMSEIK